MKIKLMSFAVAAVMAVVSLTGCSNGIKKKTVTAAKEYGMAEQDDFLTAYGYSNQGNSVFYVSKDAEEAENMRKQISTTGSASVDYNLKEAIWCTENKIDMTNVDPGLSVRPEMRTSVLVMTTKDAESARDLYSLNNQWILQNGGANGNRDGVEYSIYYTTYTSENSSEKVESYIGVYLTGNTVICLDAFTNVDNIDACTQYFCKEFGLVSPLALRK